MCSRFAPLPGRRVLPTGTFGQVAGLTHRMLAVRVQFEEPGNKHAKRLWPARTSEQNGEDHAIAAPRHSSTQHEEDTVMSDVATVLPTPRRHIR